MKLDKVEQIKINSFLHLIIDSNSVSLCRLSLIDDHQSQVDHVFKLTKYDFEQINWTNVFLNQFLRISMVQTTVSSGTQLVMTMLQI